MEEHTPTYGECQYATVWTWHPQPKRTSTADRLGPEDWTRAALAAIADKGTAHVSVERLARELGATKGSFYWHFKDRPALIDAALQRWERDYTDRIIERLVRHRRPPGAVQEAARVGVRGSPGGADRCQPARRRRRPAGRGRARTGGAQAPRLRRQDLRRARRRRRLRPSDPRLQRLRRARPAAAHGA